MNEYTICILYEILVYSANRQQRAILNYDNHLNNMVNHSEAVKLLAEKL